MNESKTITATLQTKEVSTRLSNVLASLQDNQGEISVRRARAIYKCVSSLIETVKIEAMQSTTNKEKK